MTTIGFNVFEYLRKNRVMTEVLEDGNFVFRYGDGSTFVFTSNEADGVAYCSFAVPNVAEVDDDNRLRMIQVANYVNCSSKLAKVLVYDDSVWIYYEILTGADTDLEPMMGAILNVLNDAKKLFVDSM